MPAQDQVGRRTMLVRQKDARQMLRRLRDRRELVDPADDLIAERAVAVSGAALLHLMHAFQ